MYNIVSNVYSCGQIILYIHVTNSIPSDHSTLNWYIHMSFIMNIIYTDYTNHQYDICKTVTELCELRDGVAHYGVVNRTNILLEVVCTD